MNIEDKLDKLLTDYSHVWKSKSAFMSWLRGGVRAGMWNKHPVKLDYIKTHRKQIKNPNPRGNKATVWGGTCDICKQDYVLNQLQVDHIREDSAVLRDIKDLQSFIESITLVTAEDLRLVCKPCHTIVSYSQKENMSFEEAKIHKFVIDLCKKKLDKQWLLDHNLLVPTNAVKRKKLILDTLLEESKLNEIKEC